MARKPASRRTKTPVAAPAEAKNEDEPSPSPRESAPPETPVRADGLNPPWSPPPLVPPEEPLVQREFSEEIASLEHTVLLRFSHGLPADAPEPSSAPTSHGEEEEHGTPASEALTLQDVQNEVAVEVIAEEALRHASAEEGEEEVIVPEEEANELMRELQNECEEPIMAEEELQANAAGSLPEREVEREEEEEEEEEAELEAVYVDNPTPEERASLVPDYAADPPSVPTVASPRSSISTQSEHQIDLSTLQSAELDGVLGGGVRGGGGGARRDNTLTRKYDALRKNHKLMRENFSAAQRSINSLKQQIAAKRALESQVTQLKADVQQLERDKAELNVANFKCKLSLLSSQNELNALTLSYEQICTERDGLQATLTEAQIRASDEQSVCTDSFSLAASELPRRTSRSAPPTEEELQSSKSEFLRNLQKFEQQQQQPSFPPQRRSTVSSSASFPPPSSSAAHPQADLLHELSEATKELASLKLENGRCREKMQALQREHEEKLREQQRSFKDKLKSCQVEYEDKLTIERQSREALKYNAEQVWRQLMKIEENHKTSGVAAQAVHKELQTLRDVISQKDQLIIYQSETMRVLEEKTSSTQANSAKDNEIQAERQIMSQQQEQIKRIMQVMQTKEETELMEGYLEKRVKGDRKSVV